MAVDISLDNPSSLLAPVGVLLAVYTAYVFFVHPFIAQNAKFWSSTAVAPPYKGWLGRLRAPFDSLSSTRTMLKDGYAEFSKNNKAFALPRFQNEPIVVLPGSKVNSIVHQPDSKVNLTLVLKEIVATKYFGDEDLISFPIHMQIVKEQLTRKLPLLTADVYDELVLGFENQWPAKEDEWVSVPALGSCIKIISRAANRVFCGAKLCRNEEFLTSVRMYTQGVFACSAIINLLPWWLRDAAGPFITYSTKNQLATCKKHAIPVITERLTAMKTEKPDSDREMPVDAMQWLIEMCIKRGDPAELDPDKLCRRIIRLNMVAIHTTSLTTMNVILNLYSSPRAEDFVAGLREECARVLKAHGGQWTKAAVNELYRVDSTIKESMRVKGIGMIGMFRMITDEHGVDFGDGIHIPNGVRIAVANEEIHHDPKYYDNPLEFDAFRFSRAREDKTELIEQKSQGAVTTGEKFLTFGHGKHACPGRFFACQEMKLMLAHMVLTYDVRIGGKPIGRDVGAMVLPDSKVMLEVRRRKVE